MDSRFSSSDPAKPCKTETEDNCEYGELLDNRDGQIYKTVKIGNQVWMAENLNYETTASYCYNDETENCTKYGRLYTWAAAMDSAGTWSTNGKVCGYRRSCSPTYPVRGVCPEGWHLPSKDEWNAMFTVVGDTSIAGKILKSKVGWNKEGNGTDAFGFSALPAGMRDNGGDFNFAGDGTGIWSSTGYSSEYAYFMDFDYIRGRDGAHLLTDGKSRAFSVRCLKDSD
ncbi:fibrobacter succinogenes major paralogous domain-containing protein [Fibrobacter sp. UWT3]|uniref:fibrobacter succinogenes major paralogous domain-containing protein n=1 Tax=Fibrobacter sp. UWT3 TaxID=1896225 RepID=UPI0020D0D21B|nr:fibrobacter succinogenes major paralogous domain-containing protein [Fibrobacter sp. UWT3]